MKHLYFSTLIFAFAVSAKPTPVTTYTLTTIADARKHPATYVDVAPKGESIGDMFVFDQPLLDEQKKVIGNNSGFCIRTKLGVASQCQWTLMMAAGSIQVAGRETEKGTSAISVVGGTGMFKGIRGEMQSTNNQNGTFTQVIYYQLDD